jgi:hypothetical protein
MGWLNMIYLRYLKTLLLHKLFVFYAGLFKIRGIPILRLIIHDWQKFLPIEFVPYARYFQGGKLDRDKVSFMYAWNHHVKFGEHHWEHWLLNPDYNFGGADNGKIPIPPKYIREMVADWMGASRAYTGGWDMTEWLNENLQERIEPNLHRDTIVGLYGVLSEVGYYPHIHHKKRLRL